ERAQIGIRPASGPGLCADHHGVVRLPELQPGYRTKTAAAPLAVRFSWRADACDRVDIAPCPRAMQPSGLRMVRQFKRHSVLPGFNLALGFTLLYLSLSVLIPLSAAFVKTAALSWPAFWATVTTPRVVASYRLT